MKTFKYYLKETWVIWVYTLLTMVTAMAIAMIGDDLLWLELILFALNLGLYGLVVFMMVYKSGETAAKLRHSNDIKRRVIAETGDYYDFDRVSEYGKYKGIYIGLFAGAPLLIMILIQVILDLCGSDSAAMSGAIGFTYGAFFLPLRCIDNTVSVYWSLYAVVVIVVLTHIAYTCGGLKVKRQNEKIKRTNRMIYGEHPGAKSVIGQKPIEEIVQENAKHDKRRRKKRERRKK